jgi:hypothetical protein
LNKRLFLFWYQFRKLKIEANRTFIKFDFLMKIFQGNHKGSSASGLAEITRSGLKNQVEKSKFNMVLAFFVSFFGNEKKDHEVAAKLI